MSGEAPWAGVGTYTASFFSQCLHLTICSFFRCNLGCLLCGFWESRHSKLELSCNRDAHFDKITFFAPVTFFDGNLTLTGPQNGVKGHQDPGHEVPAAVGRCVGRCRAVRRSVSGGASLGAWCGQVIFRLPVYILFCVILVSFWDPLGVLF